MAIQISESSVPLRTEPQPAIEVADKNGNNGIVKSGNPELLWTQLAATAERGDARAFVDTYHAIDWEERTPEEFERAMHWALTAGAHLIARALATRGAEQYPDHAALQKAARILAPPKLLRRLPPDPTIRANHQWLRTHRADYVGQWVALRNGQLVASGSSFEELTATCGITPEILFTKVF